MVRLYYILVKADLRTIESVPDRFREDVRLLLNAG